MRSSIKSIQLVRVISTSVFLWVCSSQGLARIYSDDEPIPIPLPEEFDQQWEPPHVWTSIRHREPGSLLSGSSAIQVSFRDQAEGEEQA